MNNNNKVVQFPNASIVEAAWSRYEEGDGDVADVMKAMLQQGLANGELPTDEDGLVKFHEALSYLAERIEVETDFALECLLFDEDSIVSDNVMPYLTQMVFKVMYDPEADDDAEEIDEDKDWDNLQKAKAKWEAESVNLPRSMPALVKKR